MLWPLCYGFCVFFKNDGRCKHLGNLNSIIYLVLQKHTDTCKLSRQVAGYSAVTPSFAIFSEQPLVYGRITRPRWSAILAFVSRSVLD